MEFRGSAFEGLWAQGLPFQASVVHCRCWKSCTISYTLDRAVDATSWARPLNNIVRQKVQGPIAFLRASTISVAAHLSAPA